MTRIRFRSDNAHLADDAARVDRGEEPLWHNADDPELLNHRIALPGDTWRVRWNKNDGEGPIAGYAICCPGCKQVHHWCTALNCEPKIPWSVIGTDGKEYTGTHCRHEGNGSCWEWSGSAEDGTLTATPSLHCLSDRGGCGWHGFLTNGEMRSC